MKGRKQTSKKEDVMSCIGFEEARKIIAENSKLKVKCARGCEVLAGDLVERDYGKWKRWECPKCQADCHKGVQEAHDKIKHQKVAA